MDDVVRGVRVADIVNGLEHARITDATLRAVLADTLRLLQRRDPHLARLVARRLFEAANVENTILNGADGPRLLRQDVIADQIARIRSRLVRGDRREPPSGADLRAACYLVEAKLEGVRKRNPRASRKTLAAVLT